MKHKPNSRIAQKIKKAKRNLLHAWIGFVCIMAIMAVMWSFTLTIHPAIFATLLLVLSLYIVFVCGKTTISNGILSAIHRNPNMNLLTSLGTIAALITGVLYVLHTLNVFPAIGNFSGIAGMIMTFHLTGSYIEQSLKYRANNAIQSLVSLQPEYATLLKDNQEVRVLSSSIDVNDLMIVKAGEQIPTDGTIIQGSAEIDESLITGESIPIYKETDAQVIGGSINTNGYIVVRIDKARSQAFLQQIINIVARAQGTKPDIQVLVDKITALFVPAILMLSMVSGIIWFLFYSQIYTFINSINIPIVNLNFIQHGPLTTAIFASIAVLVIACPCALGLATPAAIAIGVGRSAQLGVLVKNPKVFEQLARHATVAMDKTGTITEGKPSITDIYSIDDYTDFDILYIASILEQGSIHPLATSIITLYKEQCLAQKKPLHIPQADNIINIPGKGISGTFAKDTIQITNSKYIEEQQYTITKPIQHTINSYTQQGLTISIVVKNSTIIGILGFRDQEHPDSAQAIQQLHHMNYDTMMLTGDTAAAAAIIAKKVGIHTVHAQALPQDKHDVLCSLQQEGKHVVMVGDGINDAPALTQANIGVAMGSGTDIAANSGDVVLLNGHLSKLITIIKISKKTYRIIVQNLFWAFIYNVILIPIAMLGLVHPLYAEIAMGISSITVLLNSMRIARFT